MDIQAAVRQTLIAIKFQRPLILNITNVVAMDFSANALLAVGASPIMSLDIREVDELVAASCAVVINMGTLSASWIAVAEQAWATANALNKPVIFDPVGAGATNLRTVTARRFLKKYHAHVVRGNASEILSVVGDEQTTKGVDTGISSDVVAEKTRRRREHCENFPTLVISGPTDYVLSSTADYWIKNGTPKMATVTAMGCVATCIIAAFHSVHSDSAMSAVHAMAWMGICGEHAAERSSGPGSLRTAFLDSLSMDNLASTRQMNVGVL